MDETVIEVSIPLDEDGFLDRQCPSENCGGYFKVRHQDWEAAETNAVTCPFCGYVDEPANFTTVEQQEYVQQIGLAFAQEKLQEMLSGFAGKMNRRQSRNDFFSINVTTKFSKIPVPITPDALESMRQQIQCDQCNCTYAVVGAGFFCPLCGRNSARHTFQQSLAKTRNSVEVARNLAAQGADRDVAAEIKRDALENQISSLVTAFQRFGEAAYVDLPKYSTPPGRNLFQRLAEASTAWEEAGGRRFDLVLDQREWVELLKYFQQRHVLSHQDGFVDADYLRKSGDTSYKDGQRLIITEAQVLRMAELVEKLGLAMQADSPDSKANGIHVEAGPARASFPTRIPGVTDEDWKVYRIVCETAVLDDCEFIEGESVWNLANSQGLTEEQFGESLHILESKSLVRVKRYLSSRHIPGSISLTSRGLDIYFSHSMADYQSNRKRVAQAIIDEMSSSDQIVDKTALSKLFVHHTLRDFESRRWIGEIHWIGGFATVWTNSLVHLKRFVSS